MNFSEKIRVIEDFPKPSISFKDITTLLKDGESYRAFIDEIASKLADKNVELIVGPEARGFVVGAPLAYALKVGFVPVRKPGKLPAECYRYEYALEYGTDVLEVHKDAIKEGQRVAVVDDLLATGGTALATIKLVEAVGGKVVSAYFGIELTELAGREKLKNYDVHSIIKY